MTVTWADVCKKISTNPLENEADTIHIIIFINLRIHFIKKTLFELTNHFISTIKLIFRKNHKETRIVKKQMQTK